MPDAGFPPAIHKWRSRVAFIEVREVVIDGRKLILLGDQKGVL